MSLSEFFELVQLIVVVFGGFLIYRRIARQDVENLLDKLGHTAATTETPLDDAAVGFAKQLVEALLPLIDENRSLTVDVSNGHVTVDVVAVEQENSAEG